LNLPAKITQEVESSGRGRRTAAFFDFDGTLIYGFSVFFFLYRRYRKGQVSREETLEQLQAIAAYTTKRADFEGLMDEFCLGMAGQSDADLWELAEEVFKKDLAGRIYPESRALLKAHQDKGHTVVILSSATQYQIVLAADELGVDEVLCSLLEVKEGHLSGNMVGPACYGENKCAAAIDFAKQNNIDLDRSFFYTDGAEDLPLLDLIGHPRPLNPDSKLQVIADERNWPVQTFDSRGMPGIEEIIRTVLVYGSLLPSFLVGAPAWLLNRSKREVVNMAMSVWGDFGSAAAGLKINVKGEEHLWAHRPAVFIFNHQSAADALIITRLMRQDFTGISKQEMKNNPLVGPALTFADIVFIDRSRKGNAAESMKPALEKLQEGLSIVLAPEGSRSTGYTLGPFKKGAFHIAMQAGVPIIPIVIANASDSLPKSAIFIRPANIEVTVLPPVATNRWKAESMDTHVRHCRDLFLRELGQTENDTIG
jgi:putative phosphoserine phosphatase/1-acylglycerol-3-phosphate O-acyltransferase